MAGIRSLPREEQRAWERQHYAANREKLLAKAKAWQKAHPETVERMRRAYTPRRAATMRKVRYGITEPQYQAMIAEQEGLCAICKRDMKPPHVDHNHKTGRVRGLLCDNCNRGIGHLQEDASVLASAIAYLRKEMD